MKFHKTISFVLAIAVILLAALPPRFNGMATSLPQRAPFAEEAVAVVRQTCAGYAGPYPCYTSLSAWEADYGSIDFGLNANGDLIGVDKIAVARIEGTWTQADTTPLNLNGWMTDAQHYIRIYTANEARHNGTPGSGYRLVTSGSGSISSNVANFRIEGLEIHSQHTGSPIYARPGAGIDGEMYFSHNLIHGNGVDTGSGIFLYDYDGVAVIWNNIIYDVAGLGYLAGIQTARGTVYIYNNTIIDMISGFGIRSDGNTIVKNNLVEAPVTNYYGSFYPGSDFNASVDDTAPGLHSRHNQTFTFMNQTGDNFHLAVSDVGARNYGIDLSNNADIPITDDIDGDPRSGGWDIGADEATGGTDIVPPVRIGGTPSGTLPSNTTSVTLALTTNEAASCRFTTTPNVSYTAMPNAFVVTGGITHTHPIAGLEDEQTYTFYVRCQDTRDNANDDDYEISFYIFSSDTIPPLISNVQVIHITPYSAEIIWDTDEACTSQVQHGGTDTYGTTSPISTTRILSHSITLVGLDPSTTYHFRVRSQDVAYNETISGDYSFTTSTLNNFYYVNQNHPQASDTNPGTEVLPWLTIQHAADVAQPGDTIIVFPGRYERVKIDAGGTPEHYITFRGLNVPDKSLVNPKILFDPYHPVPIPGNPTVNAVMRGFTIQPPYPSTTPVAYVRIENFEITDVTVGGYVGSNAVFMENTVCIQLVRNFLHDLNPSAYGIGILASGHDNIGNVIRSNTLYRVQGVGITIMGQNWLVEENQISHGLDVSTVTGEYDGSDTDAMRFFGSGHVIRDNTMHDYLEEEQYGDPHIDCFQTFSVYPASQFAYDILVEGNNCDNFGQMFMVEDQSEENGTGNAVHHITFRNNVLRGARAVAINGSVDHFTFANNVVADSHYSAIGLTQSPYLTMVNNIFYNNGSGSQIIDEGTKVGTVWDYNFHYPEFTWPYKQPGYDQHSWFGIDPLFVDSASGNYQVDIHSPVIDRGTILHEFNYDIDFTFRPQIAAWDIGAYEAMAELALNGQSGDQTISLTWDTNLTLPVTATWQISYDGIPGSETSPITGIPSTTRSYLLTDLTNYEWYTVSLEAMLGTTSILSDTVRLFPTDLSVQLPLVYK